MIDIPMKIKSPESLGNMAADVERRIRQPQPLCQLMGSIMQPLPQASPGQFRQAAQSNRTVRPQPGQTVPGRVSQSQPWQTVSRREVSAGDSVSPGEILRKGQKLSLMRENPNLTAVEVSLGWRVQNPACDMDASAFLLGSNGKVVGDEWFVFYGQTSSPDGSVVHHGERGGTGEETLSIDLKKLHPSVKRIVFILTIHEALRQRLNFGMVSDAYIQVRDGSMGKGILRFRLDEYYSNVISMVVGELYEKNGEWRFNAVGNGVDRDLEGLCGLYGVQVE
ncbi:TerD family protein [Anaerotruncus sp. 1XD22-93]|nr:TerD family protein [Lachnospiraceae bacterium]NBH99025.1 TerD family protein [Lachnospiraceae bacterium]NBI76279.1 TerD family protein [Lachnospiraceae bacterium]RKJ82218.1 TerD family protein [Anaerotruncus sp. 1XD22-93]